MNYWIAWTNWMLGKYLKREVWSPICFSYKTHLKLKIKVQLFVIQKSRAYYIYKNLQY